MCGFFGLVGNEKYREAFKRSNQEILNLFSHRGPDQSAKVEEGIFAGLSARLKVRDLENGDQPFVDKEGRYFLFYNGEIYNEAHCLKLLESKGIERGTHSDTETFLQLLINFDIDILNEVEGIFSFMLWDAKEETLIFGKDRYGVKPLYFLQDNGLVCSSEVKPIAKLCEKGPSVQGFSEYLHNGYFPSGNTAFEGILSVNPGEVFQFKNNELTKKYETSFLKQSKNAKGIEDLIENSVQRQLVSDRPVGVFLSGGVDSSLIAHFASKHSDDLKSYTVCFDDKEFDEGAKAKKIAEHLKLEHQEYCFRSQDYVETLKEVASKLDLPFCDLGFLPLAFLSKKIKNESIVLLSGDGGDELFCGYPTISATRMVRSIPPLFNPLVKTALGLLKKTGFQEGKKNWKFRFERFGALMDRDPFVAHASWRSYFSEEEISKILRTGIERDSTIKGYATQLGEGKRKFQGDFVNQLLYGDFRTWLVNNNFFKLDRATSLSSLEGRVPLVSPELVTYAFSKKGRSKHSVRKPKKELVSLAEKLFPKEIGAFSKSSFQPPLEKWFSGELRSWVEDSLLNGDLVHRYNFSESEIRKTLESFDRKPYLEAYRIQNLLCLEYWLRSN